MAGSMSEGEVTKDGAKHCSSDGDNVASRLVKGKKKLNAMNDTSSSSKTETVTAASTSHFNLSDLDDDGSEGGKSTTSFEDDGELGLQSPMHFYTGSKEKLEHDFMIVMEKDESDTSARRSCYSEQSMDSFDGIDDEPNEVNPDSLLSAMNSMDFSAECFLIVDEEGPPDIPAPPDDDQRVERQRYMTSLAAITEDLCGDSDEEE